MTTTITRPDSVVRRLFTGLLPPEVREKSRFVWMSNFEAERFWADKNVAQLPKFSQPEDVAIVNRLEEMSLFLAEEPDILILREQSDRGFLDYLSDLGYRLPTILAVNPENKLSAIAEATLANGQVCEQLSRASQNGSMAFFLPYAKTRLEEQIMEKTGLQNVGPTAAVCEKINSKIYSRVLSNELGLRTIKGWECESFQALEESFKIASADLASGQKLVLKESMGVSGKGLYVAENERQAQQIISMLRRKDKAGVQFAFVLEHWVDKQRDINYQIFVSASGKVELLAIKEIVAEKGVHMGHRFPPALSPSQLEAYEQAGQAVGKRLFADGYVGVAGIDSIIDRDGEVYPVLEINARFNMSTYQLGLERLIPPGAKVIAKYYPLLLKEKLSFNYLTDLIGPSLYKRGSAGGGALIQNFATVNVNSDAGAAPFKGRLYVLLIGEDDDQLARLDRTMIEKLSMVQ
nr:hypothetical protein [uncultured bacterium]